MSSETLENDRRPVLALRFAFLAAEQKAEDARTAGRQLLKGLSGFQRVRWTFGGILHFVGEHSTLATKSAEWVRLFEALEEGDQSKARAALAGLGISE
jgi:hypothetical protein